VPGGERAKNRGDGQGNGRRWSGGAAGGGEGEPGASGGSLINDGGEGEGAPAGIGDLQLTPRAGATKGEMVKVTATLEGEALGTEMVMVPW
jgi:hypothetical protein